MRQATILAVTVCAVAGVPALAHGQANPSDSVAVHAVVQAFHDALARADSTGALALLADDAVILESGGIESRAEYRSHHLPADIRFAGAVPAKRGPLSITVRGDVGWVSSTSETVGTYNGRAVNSAGAELVVLSRFPDGWRIRAIHWSSRRRS